MERIEDQAIAGAGRPARTVAGAIVGALADAGVRHVFGIPGVHNLALFEALAADGRLRVIPARHEQGAAFMADGYARATGAVGVVFVITGPGLTNALTAIAEAYSDSSAVAVFATEIETPFIGQERGFVHELADQMAMARQVCKWTGRITRPADAVALATAALSEAARGRRRPVYVEIPIDVLAQPLDRPAEAAPAAAPAPAGPPAEDLARVLALLREARSPVLYVGGGLATPAGRRALKRFAEQAGMPVVTTTKGKSAFPADHPLAVGGSSWAPEVIESDLLREADLLLAVGTRLSARLKYGGYGNFRLPERLVHVDVDPAVIGQNYPTALGIVADGTATLARLAESFAAEPAGREEGLARARRSRETVAAALEEKAPAVAGLLRDLRRVLPSEAIFVADNALAGIWTARYFPVYEPGQFLFPMGYATLGFAVPAAIGARLGCPARPVVAVVGDGGFLFSAQELAVAAQLDLDLTVLLFNDGRYGSVHYNQRRRYGRAVASELANPDFAQLAAAFHCAYTPVAGPEGVAAALQDALERKGVTLVEVDSRFLDWY